MPKLNEAHAKVSARLQLLLLVEGASTASERGFHCAIGIILFRLVLDQYRPVYTSPIADLHNRSDYQPW